MTSENVKKDQSTKNSRAAFFNNESGELLFGKHNWSLIGFCFYLQVGVINLIVKRNQLNHPRISSEIKVVRTCHVLVQTARSTTP